MSKGTIVGLILGVLGAAVVAIIIGTYAFTASTVATQNNEYCDNWYLQIEQRRSELTGEWFQTDAEWDVFNQQVDAYNEECAY